MADLSIEFQGIRSPNPFWLASGPLTNSGYQVQKAFDQGWGGAVWKTLGDPVVNVSSRLGALNRGTDRLIGLNNIELISDRPLADNLREIREVKRQFPDHALIISVMLGPDPEQWKDFLKQCEDTGADGFELNYGCPHGMSERGLGATVGQVPDIACEMTAYARAATQLPIIVKLTPNVTDIREAARAGIRGGADGLSLINTINSVMGVDLENWVPYPQVDGYSSHGGYCGPAVKPIALHMLSSLYLDGPTTIPLSGMGGIETWRDAAEFLLLGATSLQVCTAAMHHGFRIIEDLTAGLSHYLDEKGITQVGEIVGHAAFRLRSWGDLNLNYRVVAQIDQDRCIGCNLCYVACEDGAHQCIDRTPGQRAPVVREADCVGCNLCALVCPVPGCIEMVPTNEGRPFNSWNQRLFGIEYK